MCDNISYQGQKPPLICKICYKTDNIRRCSRCQSAYYCSNTCQRADWPYHKTQCQESNKHNHSRVASVTTNSVNIQTTQASYLLPVPVSMQSFTVSNNVTMQPPTVMDINAAIQQQQIPQQQPAVVSIPNIDQSYYAPYCNNNLILDNNGINMSDINPNLYSPSSTSTLSPTTSQQQQQLNSQYCMEQLSQPNIMTCASMNDSLSLQQQSQQQQQQQENVDTLTAQQSLLLEKELNEIVENGIDLRDELNDILFGNGELANLQLDCDEDIQNHLGICQENTMHISSDNFINNSELNSPYSYQMLELEQRGLEDMCTNLIKDLNEYGVCVLDNFLGYDKGLQVLREVNDMYNDGIFKDGQVVSNRGITNSRNVRGDKITWVDGKEPGHCNLGHLINQVDAVVTLANRMKRNGKLSCYNIRERTKAMVACYPGSGTHYVKHVDNPNRDGRCITAIYYLNLDWDVSRHGGLLRIFPEGCNDRVADIEPIFDRILFFWSDRRNPHEVQPAHRTRYAITLWYLDARERESAIKRYQKGISPS